MSGPGAVFLDKDGTLIENVPYNVDPALVSLAAGALDGLQLLKRAGYRLVLISNQSGVARGFFPESALKAVWNRVESLLSSDGLSIDGYYYCPHHPKGSVAEFSVSCDCRKPAPGLILKAAKDLNIDLKQSWMIGDQLDDVEAGQRAGCRTVLIDPNFEQPISKGLLRMPDLLVKDFADAAALILAQPRSRNASEWVDNKLKIEHRFKLSERVVDRT